MYNGILESIIPCLARFSFLCLQSALTLFRAYVRSSKKRKRKIEKISATVNQALGLSVVNTRGRMEDGANRWSETRRSPLTEGKHEMDGVARLVDIRG